MKKGVFALLVLTLITLRAVTTALTPVFDPSEARYAVMSANMSRTGDYVVPHFTYQGVYQSFDGKPPLVFQAGALACEAFGINEFSVRLFPLLTAILLGFVLYHTVKKFSTSERARLAVLIYGSSAAFYAAAGFAMTDGPLAAAVAGALLLYWCFTDKYELKYAFGVAVMLGAGMIIKGPVSFVLFAFPVFIDACLNRHWKAVFNWRWLAVLPVALLIAVPWFVLVEQRNPGAVEYFFVNENFKRFLYKEYGDKYGAGRETFRGMALVWTFLATLPWALLPLWKAIRTRAMPQWKSFTFLSVAAITFFWCLPSHTLISYLLPVVPLFAAHLAMNGCEARLTTLSVFVVPSLAVTLTLGLLIAPRFVPEMAGKAAPDYFGFHNRYAHEFYHGTSESCLAPSEETINRLKFEALKTKFEAEKNK